MLNTDTIIAKAPNVVSRMVGHEAIIILPAQGEVKVLNDVGARIWELADGVHSIADILEKICDEYAVPYLEAETDTLEFVQNFVDRKLLVIL